MKPELQTEYIVSALHLGASMYEDDARAFLAEHDAHVRTKALTEAEGKAREVVAKLWDDGTTQKRMDRADGARAVEWEIGLMASGNDEPEEKATPDFFQPGHRYAWDVWRFHCATVTTHPDSGERQAIGWIQISDGSWTTYAYSAPEWGGDWTDVTEAGDR